MKSDLIEKCKFYNGEDICPYQGTDIRSMFWFYESAWVSMEINDDDVFKKYLTQYKRSKWYEVNENVPMNLKAMLYNRYCHFVDIEGEGFKEYFQKYMEYNK